MNYCLKYFVSFACSLLIFFLGIFFSNLTCDNIPLLKSWLWIVEKSSIEIFFRLFTVQSLAVLFVFSFWTEEEDRRKWRESPFRFVLTLFFIYFVFSAFLYTFKEHILVAVSRNFYTIEENARAMATLKTELIALKAQKAYLEDSLSEVEEGSSRHQQLYSAYFQVLTQILHVYCRQATIEDSVDLQENIRVARTAVKLQLSNRPNLNCSLSVPFDSLSQLELERLYRSFEQRQDYVTALYFLRLLQVREPEEALYKDEEDRIKTIIENPYEESHTKAVRSIFAEKQSYYLNLHLGTGLEDFYAVQDFLRRYPDDRDAQMLFKRLDSKVRKRFVFVQDIVDSFEMGGPRSTLLLNKNTKAYREYVYLGKIVGVASRVVVRDVAIMRIHPKEGLLLYITVPYATFDQQSNSLVFDVVDDQVADPYLEPAVRVGSWKESLCDWKIDCPFEAVHAFSSLRFSLYSDLSFCQLWEAMCFARKVDNTQLGRVFLYDLFKRIGTPLVFVFLSLCLTFFALKYPAKPKFRFISLLTLIAGCPMMGAWVNFLCEDLMALLTYLVYACHWLFLPIVFLSLFALLWCLLGLANYLKSQKAELP